VELSGEVAELREVDPQALRQEIQRLEEQNANLEASSAVRLYTGLAQGAIAGLITGGVAAWIIGRRVRIVPAEAGEDEQEETDR